MRQMPLKGLTVTVTLRRDLRFRLALADLEALSRTRQYLSALDVATLGNRQDFRVIEWLPAQLTEARTKLSDAGIALAGVAGLLSAPRTGLTPDMGTAILIFAFVVVVIGGLLVSTFFTLLLTPALMSLMMGMQETLRNLFRRGQRTGRLLRSCHGVPLPAIRPVASAVTGTGADHVVLTTAGDWLLPLASFLSLREGIRA